MNASSLYTNVQREEGKEIVCKAYERFLDPPISARYPKEMLGVILTENSFEFSGKN